MSHPQEDAEERLSCEFDLGNISPASSEEPGRDFVESATQSWTEIGDAMRQIPLEPSGLHKGVMHALAVSQRPIVNDSSPSRAPRGSLLFASFASVCALLITGLLTTSVNDRPSQESVAETAFLPELFEGVRNTKRNDWQVVVVNVPEEDHARIRNKIAESVVNQGLAVDSVNSGSQVLTQNSPDVLISTGDTSLEVLRALEIEIRDSDGDMTTELPAEFDRDELLSRFRESMESPTESDRYFGEMLVIHADSEAVTLSAEPIAGAEAVAVTGATSLPRLSSTANSLATTAGATGASGMDPIKQRPVLVVLVKKKTAEPGPQSGRSGPLAPRFRAATLITG